MLCYGQTIALCSPLSKGYCSRSFVASPGNCVLVWAYTITLHLSICVISYALRCCMAVNKGVKGQHSQVLVRGSCYTVNGLLPRESLVMDFTASSTHTKQTCAHSWWADVGFFFSLEMSCCVAVISLPLLTSHTPPWWMPKRTSVLWSGMKCWSQSDFCAGEMLFEYWKVLFAFPHIEFLGLGGNKN